MSTPSPASSQATAPGTATPYTSASSVTTDSMGDALQTPASMATPTPDQPGHTNAATPATAAASASRRPPRKSTLTQQQKNQKRQRATPDQLSLLEVEFNRNPTPTGPVRERIAQDINMTERSVQIWFQNRRAKIKLLAKKSIETGEDCDAIPESYRQYLAMQALESGKPLGAGFLTPAGFGNNLLLGGESQVPPKMWIQHFQCRSLTIGTWRRIGQNAMDLVIFYSLGERPCLTYYINNEAAGYKIEYPFSYIKNITLEQGPPEDPMRHPAGLLVELNRPPNFFMDSSGSGGFYQCGDFTENQQASQVLMHHLGGDPHVLSGQLAKLTMLDAFQNRLNPFLDNNAVAVSAPVSPIGIRPASQPNAMPPPPTPSAVADAPFANMSLQPPRGHKRTRSRSVPALTDFSFLQQPMPSFHIQHPSTTVHDPSIFAPVPQHAAQLTPAVNLRIDTTQPFSLDSRAMPMSAATTTSPSDFASPGFFMPGPATAHPASVDSMPAPTPATAFDSYGLPLMPAVLPENSVTPTPAALGTGPMPSPMAHGDPVIAGHSPPLQNLHRSASADFLSMGQQDHSGVSLSADEALMLGDMFAKPNLTLPIRSPPHPNPAYDLAIHEPTAEELAMASMLPFGTIDPSQLTPTV